MFFFFFAFVLTLQQGAGYYNLCIFTLKFFLNLKASGVVVENE